MSEYKLKDKGIQANTEYTSAISTISYEVENGLYSGLNLEQINKQLEKFQRDGKFPSNLQLVEAFYDPKTSLSGVAFKDTTTGRVTIGMAGTNLDNGVIEKIKDLGADASIAFNGPASSANYFSQGNQFIANLKEKYPIEAITGHSKGGRDVVVLGVAHNIPTIITYNPAPITHDFLQASTSLFIASPLKMGERSFKNADMKQQFLNYKGTIVHMVSNKDWLTSYSDLGRALYIGDRYTINNEKSHEVTGFLGKNEQSFIRSALEEHTQLGQVVGAEMAQAVTKKRLKEIKNLKKKFLKNGSTSLSASQEIYLDAVEAEALTEGMKYTLQEQITDLKKMYVDEIKSAGTLWNETLESARNVGSHLSENELIASLGNGGATLASILEKPMSKSDEALQKLTAIEESYDALLVKIREAIQTQIEADTELASQLGGN